MLGLYFVIVLCKLQRQTWIFILLTIWQHCHYFVCAAVLRWTVTTRFEKSYFVDIFRHNLWLLSDFIVWLWIFSWLHVSILFDIIKIVNLAARHVMPPAILSIYFLWLIRSSYHCFSSKIVLLLLISTFVTRYNF